MMTFLVGKEKNRNDKDEYISINTLLIGTSASMTLSLYQSYVHSGNISPTQFILGSGLVLFTIVYLGSKYLKRNWVNKWTKKYGIYPMLWFAVFTVWFGDILAFPASAAGEEGTGVNPQGFFFRNIQIKITSILAANEDANDAIGVIAFGFGILQLAFIIYIAFSIFQAVKAQQQDEEWIQAAKVPLIVLFAVTAGDFAVSLI